MMKKILFLFSMAILLLENPIFAQSDKLPENKYDKWKDVNKVYHREFWLLSFGTSQTSFLNPSFGVLVDKKIITQNRGFSTNFKWTRRPFIFEVTYFRSKYNYNVPNHRDTIFHRGLSVDASLFLLPRVKYNLTDYFNLYVGTGIQTSSLMKNESSSVNLNGLYYKAGAMLNYKHNGLGLYLVYEYRRSIYFSDNNHDFYQSFFTIGYSTYF